MNLNKVRSMFFISKVLIELWIEVVKIVVYIMKRLLSMINLGVVFD